MVSRLLLWGAIGGAGVAALKYIEYRWFVAAHAGSIWGGLVALAFAGLGLWLGRRLWARPSEPPPAEGGRPEPTSPATGSQTSHGALLPAAAPDASASGDRDEARGGAGLTPREVQVLELIAAGHSNREIAARLFVSENTVKTHSARVFDKLGARRRTQAVQRARELGVIGAGHPKA